MPRAPDGTAYEWHGPPDAPVIALIHGLGLNRDLWRAHIPALSARWRVLNYDLCGHGESRPPPSPMPATLALYSEQLRALMDETGVERAAIVGFSIGGMINRRFALDHPGRVAALAILNSPHERGMEAQAQVEARASKVAQEGRMATMQAALERWFTPEFIKANPDILAWTRAARQKADPESYAQAAMVLANGVPELVRPATPITAPALVMTSEHDSGSTPAMSRAIAAEIPDARLRIIPRLRHLGLMEEPEAFTGPIVEFLESEDL